MVSGLKPVGLYRNGRPPPRGGRFGSGIGSGIRYLSTFGIPVLITGLWVGRVRRAMSAPGVVDRHTVWCYMNVLFSNIM